jgi:transketolase
MPSRKQLANAIRALSMDAVQKAKSGHPGAPMGMADIAEVLWREFLQHNPANPNFANRDRFVLSNGHGSMLLYSLLHLSGYDLTIDDLKQFRQLHSRTPGHPEYGYAPGVETTTGPLGQGITNAVGMAIAEKALAAQFNQPGHEAGTLGLGKLIAFWDDNGISIDGHVEGWFTDNTPGRFAAYGWHVIADVDGHDAEAVRAAIVAAQQETDKPTLICCKTIIGYGSPNKSGSHDCHGAPLGDAEIAASREFLQWPHAPFEIPADIYAAWDGKAKGADLQQSWQQRFDAYQAAFPALASELTRRLSGELPADWSEKSNAYIAQLQATPATIASRKASQNALNAFGPLLPEFMGGSADLAGSNLTLWSGSKGVSAEDASGNYLFYGVREFGMSAIMNGIALHGGFIPYGATFLMFMEYARNAVRMAALMKQRVIFVYTHDSIGLGEDGPTHQPVEQLASLRVTPNLMNWRPCDQVESAVAWQAAIERTEGPTTLIFTRQNLKQQERTAAQLADIRRGGYVLQDCAGMPELILIATGSEVELAMQAAATLTSKGRAVRVVSMPSTDVFEAQDAAYREAVLPASVTRRVAVEAGITDSWYKYVGLTGKIIGMNSFGESAPAEQLFEYFGITTTAVVSAAEELLA